MGDAGRAPDPTSAEHSLMREMAAFRDIVEDARNGIVVIACTGRVLVFNRMARQILGDPGAPLVGRHLSEVLPAAWEDMRPICGTGRAQIARKVAVGGHTVIANRTPVRVGGRVAAILSVFQGLADYETIVSELETYRQLHAQLDVIIDSSYDGLWICDAAGKVVRVNRASEKMSGVKEADVIGRGMAELVEEGLFDKSATLEVLRNKAAVTLIQTLQDGRQVLVTGNPVLDSDGRLRLVVVNARDISELNRLHVELEESKALNFQYCTELNLIKQYRARSSQIVLRSAAMQRIFEMAMRVARVDSSVLITGESGCGKTKVAEMIHGASGRRTAPLVQVNCGAIPEPLIEAELFGYERGAFTGAQANGKAGYFEMAHTGTLLLDEIGELPVNMQVKLLRFLEKNEVVRIGATTARRLDVRVLAATNRDLERMVAAGSFRKDLFFRLNVVPLKIPPLRERNEDIPALVFFFLKKFNHKFNTRHSLSPAVIDCLCGYAFPGNIRELANLVERLVVLTPGEQIGLADLPAAVRDAPAPSGQPADERLGLDAAHEELERRMILRALKIGGSQRRAAKLLRIHHSTLSRKIGRLGITPDASRQHGAGMQHCPSATGLP